MMTALDTACSGNGDDIQVSGIVSAIQNAASPSSTPSRFDQDFERLELLGRGGFGEVWRARNRVDQCEYAIKVVSYHFNQDEGPFAHLAHPALREAQTWATVKHPNVVRYHAAWVEVDNGTEDQPLIAESHKLPLPPVHPGGAHVSTVDGDSTWSENSSGSNDSSDGGVLFEASTSNKADINSTTVGTPLEVAPTTEGRHEMQIVPHHLPMPTISRKRRATLYVQLEFVRGGTLRQWIDHRNAALSSGDVNAEGRKLWAKWNENIVTECVDAVAHLHSRGLLHRDIKPANIFLTEDGSIRLGDFGLAKTADSPVQQFASSQFPQLVDTAASKNPLPADIDDGRMPMHTRGVGTPSYASPEQLRGHKYDTKVDIFALGMIFAELLFPVRTHMEHAAIIEGLRARQLPDAVAIPYQAKAMILAMTSMEPSERPNAGELAACLHKRQLNLHEMCTCCHEAGRKPPYRPVECPQYLNAALPVLCMPSF